MLLFLHQTINCPILLGLTFISVNVQREIWSKEKEVEADDDDDFQRLYMVFELNEYSSLLKVFVLTIFGIDQQMLFTSTCNF